MNIHLILEKILKNKWHIISFFLFIIYIFIRFQKLIIKDVPYTYDQGRDFLKTAEIFLYRNLTFIGPTTGIMGLYHGAWWYYILGMPFLITKGNLIAFYYLIFFITLITNLIFFIFIKKYFGNLPALFSLMLITFSPYFINISTFAINTVLVHPFFACFLILNFLLLEEKINQKQKYLLLIGLSLGFIFEFEFGFGFFLIPLYLLLIFLNKYFKNIFSSLKNWLFFIAGILIPFFPRILFEIKNNFLQTRTLINFLITPKYFNPKPFEQVFNDRLITFFTYLKDPFSYWLVAIIFYFILLKLNCFFCKRKIVYNNFFKFLLSLFFGLFAFSILYRDNFWSYYYEGIQYLIILIIIVVFYQTKNINRIRRIIIPISLINIIFFILTYFPRINFNLSRGLITRQKIVNFITSQEKNQSFCVNIYTPPVVPYTYEYLFLYSEINKQIKKPTINWINNPNNWVNNQCWYIIEKDDIKERRKQWIKNNLPKNYKTIFKKNIIDTELIKIQRI